MALCLSEAEYSAACRHLKVEAPPHWIRPGADATLHTFTHQRKTTCVVCLSEFEGRDPIEVAGLLIHEAVHVWQHYCDDIGETHPGAEQEAYAVQSIAQELLAEFARRMAA